jgi:hypothetical protein
VAAAGKRVDRIAARIILARELEAVSLAVVMPVVEV